MPKYKNTNDMVYPHSLKDKSINCVLINMGNQGFYFRADKVGHRYLTFDEIHQISTYIKELQLTQLLIKE